MRILKIDSCENCPYLILKERDWDFKDMPFCRKLQKNLSKERIDLRFNNILKSIPEICDLSKES